MKRPKLLNLTHSEAETQNVLKGLDPNMLNGVLKIYLMFVCSFVCLFVYFFVTMIKGFDLT